jgi:hypothetical protein
MREGEMREGEMREGEMREDEMREGEMREGEIREDEGLRAAFNLYLAMRLRGLYGVDIRSSIPCRSGRDRSEREQFCFLKIFRRQHR